MERLHAPFTKGVAVDGAELRHVADGRRADAEWRFAINNDQSSHRASPFRPVSPSRKATNSGTRSAASSAARTSRARVLALDEKAKLLEALHPRFQRFVRFDLGTGCRLDEIRCIDPKRDIDWTRGTVHVTGR
ncbi:MAG: hypothetical protein ACRD26_22550 [Vicinamibacterales bacterium]